MVTLKNFYSCLLEFVLDLGLCWTCGGIYCTHTPAILRGTTRG